MRCAAEGAKSDRTLDLCLSSCASVPQMHPSGDSNGSVQAAEEVSRPIAGRERNGTAGRVESDSDGDLVCLTCQRAAVRRGDVDEQARDESIRAELRRGVSITKIADAARLALSSIPRCAKRHDSEWVAGAAPERTVTTQCESQRRERGQHCPRPPKSGGDGSYRARKGPDPFRIRKSQCVGVSEHTVNATRRKLGVPRPPNSYDPRRVETWRSFAGLARRVPPTSARARGLLVETALVRLEGLSSVGWRRRAKVNPSAVFDPPAPESDGHCTRDLTAGVTQSIQSGVDARTLSQRKHCTSARSTGEGDFSHAPRTGDVDAAQAYRMIWDEGDVKVTPPVPVQKAKGRSTGLFNPARTTDMPGHAEARADRAAMETGEPRQADGKAMTHVQCVEAVAAAFVTTPASSREIRGHPSYRPTLEDLDQSASDVAALTSTAKQREFEDVNKHLVRESAVANFRKEFGRDPSPEEADQLVELYGAHERAERDA